MNFEDNHRFCFEFFNDENGNKLINFIRGDLNTKVYLYNFNNLEEGNLVPNYKAIAVDKEKYKFVISEGIKFLNQNNIKDIVWIDVCGYLKKCNTFDIAEMQVPMERNVKTLWGINSKMPKDIKLYLNSLDKYLGIETIKECDETTNCIYLSVFNDNYNDYSQKLTEFVNKNGIGPFEGFIPLTKYGEYNTKVLKR